jgi:hypothetical protein
MSAHTPGPWIVHPKSRGEWIVPASDSGKAIGASVDVVTDRERFAKVIISQRLGSGSTRFEAGEREANARLIAAAPELLAALKKALGFAGVAYGRLVDAGKDEQAERTMAFIETCESVIAKAESK